jgi:hypothetical protein
MIQADYSDEDSDNVDVHASPALVASELHGM